MARAALRRDPLSFYESPLSALPSAESPSRIQPSPVTLELTAPMPATTESARWTHQPTTNQSADFAPHWQITLNLCPLGTGTPVRVKM